MSLLLLLPLGHQILIAHSFLAGTGLRLDSIFEMYSLPRQLAGPYGIRDVWNFYSLLAFAIPFTAIFCACKAYRERSSGRVFFWISSILGLIMLCMQFRLHYFGSFALYLPWLVLIDSVALSHPERRKQTFLIAFLAFTLIYYRPLRYQLAAPWPPGNDPSLADLRPMLATLQKECAKDPGVVLADSDAGHYIRYFTDCSVIANNFLLTPQHFQKITEMDHLLSLPAQELPDAAPFVRYVLIRPANVVRTGPDDYRYLSFTPETGRLIADLLMKPAASHPAAYILLDESFVAGTNHLPYARLFAIQRGQQATRGKNP
jgi:hypothetical protein